MSTLSTHVLDTSTGKPAAGVAVRLERVSDATTLGAATTDQDGRLRDFVSSQLTEGAYRLRFDVGGYFARQQRAAFFPEIVVVFQIGSADEHYHVPVLISPFGYSTYRGS